MTALSAGGFPPGPQHQRARRSESSVRNVLWAGAFRHMLSKSVLCRNIWIDQTVGANLAKSRLARTLHRLARDLALVLMRASCARGGTLSSERSTFGQHHDADLRDERGT